jgi:hypothetical protein
VFCNIVYQSYSLFLWQVLFCPHNPVYRILPITSNRSSRFSSPILIVYGPVSSLVACRKVSLYVWSLDSSRRLSDNTAFSSRYHLAGCLPPATVHSKLTVSPS